MKKIIILFLTLFVLTLTLGGYFVLILMKNYQKKDLFSPSTPEVQVKIDYLEEPMEEVLTKFLNTDLEDWNYQKDEFCLNGLGFRAKNPDLIDFLIDPLKPEILLVDENENVIGLEYLIPSRDVKKPMLFGKLFKSSNPYPPVITFPHLYLRFWLIDNPKGEFASFNPNVVCPEGTLPKEFYQNSQIKNKVSE